MASWTIFDSQLAVFSLAFCLRTAFLMYGVFQDAYSPMKYTDIDYYVFTDAARYIWRGQSPYARDTYRYTPLLAWMLYPTAWSNTWFSFGKILFALGDIVTGWMMFQILQIHLGIEKGRALKYASIWLLNPMVAIISTRGSSEGLLAVFVTALLWATLGKRIVLAGCLLGFAVHFKVYPVIYAASIIWWLDDGQSTSKGQGWTRSLADLITTQRVYLATTSLITFSSLNVLMYSLYGWDFVQHSYLYHAVRSDHRHNFSLYNTLLYLNSSPQPRVDDAAYAFAGPERLAFVPQMILSAFIIPLMLAKKDLPSTMLAQTFAFVAFNKVCTSQYFLWYMMFLPYYLPGSTFLKSNVAGIFALSAWIIGQVVWLRQGYQLEFNGHSAFVPDLWFSSILFFVVNVNILGTIIQDVKSRGIRISHLHTKKIG